MQHPLSQFESATLWHLLQNYAPELGPKDTVFFEPSEATAADLPIAQRLINVFHSMLECEARVVPLENRPNSGVWEMVKNEFHAEFITLLLERDAPNLASYLSNFLRKSVSYGLGPGLTVYEAMLKSHQARDANLIMLADRLASLAVAIGALKHENPEQGHYGSNSAMSILDLTVKIQAKLGVEIFRPPVAGVFGVSLAPDQIIDVRVPDDAYTAYRVRQLLDISIGSQVAEIGAGFAGSAFQAHRMGIRPYSIFDLPTINILQGYFLMRVFGGDAVRMFGEVVETRPFNVLPYWTFFDHNEQFDLVVNRDSMPEMPEARAREYVMEMERRGCAFLSINQEAEAPGSDEKIRQLVVSDLVAQCPKFVTLSRHMHWTRKGYVEELFIAKK